MKACIYLDESDRKINSLIEKCDKSNKIVLINFVDSYKVPEWEELAATSMAVQNMWYDLKWTL